MPIIVQEKAEVVVVAEVAVVVDQEVVVDLVVQVRREAEVVADQKVVAVQEAEVGREARVPALVGAQVLFKVKRRVNHQLQGHLELIKVSYIYPCHIISWSITST